MKEILISQKKLYLNVNGDFIYNCPNWKSSSVPQRMDKWKAYIKTMEYYTAVKSVNVDISNYMVNRKCMKKATLNRLYIIGFCIYDII